MNLEDEYREIKSSKEFCKALGELLGDPGFPNENKCTVEYVGAMKAWLEAFEGRNTLFEASAEEGVSWGDLYKLLRIAADYE
ncbi:hypothetical protein [Roseibium sediminis]|uniref:hypothetical protein n=1 Tax=Roseibium sediminis TaxID=1775174 RepID=UPI00123E0ECB|nr:hypothetical protein [Roseibium sediminis]